MPTRTRHAAKREFISTIKTMTRQMLFHQLFEHVKTIGNNNLKKQTNKREYKDRSNSEETCLIHLMGTAALLFS